VIGRQKEKEKKTMMPLLSLLEAVSFEAERKKMSRSAFLAKAGIADNYFNAVISGRVELTKEEQRRLGDLIPMPLHELFRPGPSRSSRERARPASREQR